VLALVGAYVLWVLTMIIAFGVCVSWQGVLLRIYTALGWNKYGLAGFNYAVIIILLGIWLVLVVATEHWYRRAAEQGTLLRRVAWTLGILIALLGVALAIGRLA
jgi:hypothetical protein